MHSKYAFYVKMFYCVALKWLLGKKRKCVVGCVASLVTAFQKYLNVVLFKCYGAWLF